MSQEEVNRVREEIARFLYYLDYFDDDVWENEIPSTRLPYYEQADQILSIKTGNKTIRELIEGYSGGSLLEKAEDQKPPEFITASGISDMELVEATRQSMRKPDKDGNYFVKVIGGSK